MTVFATLLATAATLAALGWLATTDPKRRRVFGLPPFGRPRRTAVALAAALLPGVALAMLGNAAAFTAWFGAATVAGWGVAAMPPAQASLLWFRLMRGAAQARAAATALSGEIAGGARKTRHAIAEFRRMQERIASLEGRVAALEAALQGASDDRAAAERRYPAAIHAKGPAGTPEIATPDRALEGAGARI